MYVRAKADAVFERPGLPAVSGAVRIVRAAAHHVQLLWSAGAESRLGNAVGLAQAEQVMARELADRPADRLRVPAERATPHGDTARRPAAPPRGVAWPPSDGHGRPDSSSHTV